MTVPHAKRKWKAADAAAGGWGTFCHRLQGKQEGFVLLPIGRQEPLTADLSELQREIKKNQTATLLACKRFLC